MKVPVLRFVRRWTDDAIYPAAAVFAALIMWEVAVVLFRIPVYILPRPSEVVSYSVKVLPMLVAHGGTTLQEIMIGFVISVVVGVALAMLMTGSQFFRKVVYPLLIISQTVPKVALAPLFLVWFGFGILPKVLIVFLIAFFPIVISTAVGLQSLPVELIDIGRSTGASNRRIFNQIRLPYALPNIFGGLKVAITLAVVGAIYGEFVGADHGLGYLLLVASGRMDMVLLFAVVFVLVAIGLVLFAAIGVIERLLIPWHHATRNYDPQLSGG